MESYLHPYVTSQNFSGSVAVARDGKRVFGQSYGAADAEAGVNNTLQTRYHIASLSMQFTAAAILRLADAGRLSLDAPVTDVVPDLPNSGKITIRHLLTQTSGMADINDLADYPQILAVHQTPDSLVKRILGLPPLREPGGVYVREEHSAYNLLALIVEKTTGLAFGPAVRQWVFAPLGMSDSGIDDDSPLRGAIAKGYEPLGASRLQPAPAIHWSAKTGNASAYTTVLDVQKWLVALFNTAFLSESARTAMFDMSTRAGYGWFKSTSTRFDGPVYYMNGRSPGFASAVVYLPKARLSAVVLGNVYASFTTRIANDLAALAQGLPAESPRFRSTPLTPAETAGLQGGFTYGADFYQPKATLLLSAGEGEAVLKWPNGDISALVPTEPDRFIDRAYGVAVEVKRDGQGKAVQLVYDRFTGGAAGP